jgi:hypothetical protein
MSEHYPRIRVPAQRGSELVREGLSISFYMRHSHQQIMQNVLRSLEAYLRAIGPQALGWYFDDEGMPWPLDERGWKITRQELCERPSPRIGLRDASDTENRYLFDYYGKNLESPHVGNEPGAVCAATFWLPTEFLEERGPGRVRELAMELAAPLPLCSGHAGLSFNAEYDLMSAKEQIARYWLRYPGIDVYDSPSSISWNVGTRVRAPHWLTFLGQPVLGELGGARGLRARLQSPGTTVQELGDDKVLITLGARPEAGDTERGDTLPAYRELARVLEPWLFRDPDGRMLGQSEDDTRRWERRFLD